MIKGEQKDERVRAEEKYKALVETAPDAVFTFDLLGRFTFVNPAGERISGYSEEELLGKHFRELLPANYIPACLNVFQKALRGQPTAPIEVEMMTKQGKRVPLELLGRPVKRGRRVVEIIGIGRDITERKRTEEALRESEERYRSVVENSHAGIIILDDAYRLIYVNDELCRISGYSREEIIGQDFQSFLDDESKQLVADRYVRRQRGEKVPPRYEFNIVRKNGEKRRIEISSTVTKDSAGRVKTVAQILDIAERKKAEEEIRRRNEELATLNAIAVTVSNTLELQEVLHAIQSKVMELLGEIYPPLFFLFNEEHQTFTATPTSLQEEGLRRVEKLMGVNFEEVSLPLPTLRPALRETLLAGKPYLTDDLSDLLERGILRRLKDVQRELEINSIVGLPLWAKGKLAGIVLLVSPKEAMPDEEIELLSAIANQIGVAIENARLYEETQKRLAETTVLHKVAEIINATLDLKEVFQRVVEELSNTFGYRLVDIYLLEEDGLRLQANTGYDAQTTIELIPLERGVTGRVARTGQPAFIRDISQDPDYIGSYPEIKSEICVPVMSGGTILGTLNVESDDKRPLTDHDLQLLSILSSHIGVAIENARLYEGEQRLSTQRKTIAEVGRRVASILEMDTLLPQVVDLIAQNFGYYRVHIFQVDQDSSYAVYRAGTGEAAASIAEEGLRLKIGEEGLVGWVAQHGEPLLVHDVSQDPRYYAHPDLPDTRSELDVPIQAGEKVIGVLDVQSTELDAFDESDLDTLRTLADQLAVALENARLYQETERLAITDGLTGLHNLRYFYEALEKEIQRSERYHRSVSLIILDIDNFKRYNDTYGHLAGDDLLKELAQLMSGVTRQTDTLARYGGEEFAIILPETETEGAIFLAERLQEEVREHRFSIQDGQTIGRITISLGVAAYPHHADSAKALVDAADKALLKAKQAGKNRLSVYGEELTELKPR